MKYSKNTDVAARVACTVKVAFLFLLLASAVFGDDRFAELSLPEHAQVQIGHGYYGNEDWKVVVSKGVDAWQLMIHRSTNHKEPIYIRIPEETAKDLIADGVLLLQEFTFSGKGYEPPGDEAMGEIRVRALSGRERIEVIYFRGPKKDRYPKLEEYLARLSKLIPDEYSQYRF